MVPIPATVNYVETTATDALQNTYTFNITKGFGPTQPQSYNYVDTVARSLVALTTLTYGDSNVVMTKSVNDALAEEGE